MQFDILVTRATRTLPTRMLNCLLNGAAKVGIDARIMHEYQPRPKSVLMLYGLGAPDRRPYAQAHRDRGWHYVALDAGYWERKTDDRKYRVSIDGFHCPQLIMRGPDPGPERLNLSGISMTSMENGAGNIILIGNGPKAGACGADGWAAAKSREIRAMHPTRPITYRPKRIFFEKGVIHDGVALGDKIERILAHASLVVCRHSNVAVDACRMGIPVVCEDGAAAAIYPSRLEDEAKQPSIAVRAEFLRRLAWWQWSMGEMEKGLLWTWLVGALNEVR